MADDDRTTNNAQAHQQPPQPNPDLKSLERFVGTWEMSGEVRGRVTYEWMEGGFFLIQRVDLEQYGQRFKGIEIIGPERPFGAEPSEEIKSRFYSNTGDTLDYVYELEGDTLTIWGGEKGSPAYYTGTFGADGNTLTGAWHYPGAVVTRRPRPGSSSQYMDIDPPVSSGSLAAVVRSHHHTRSPPLHILRPPTGSS
jgi:hypothetical protein